MEADSFGGAEDVLLAQEVKLDQLQGENRVLGAAVEALQDKLRTAEARAAAATKRAAEAEAKLHAKAAGASADAERLAAAQEEVQRLKHQLQNERVLQAERRRGAEQAAAADAQALQRLQSEAAQLRSSNTKLQERLAAANVQLRQLESLQPFADGWTEQREASQRRERELVAARDAAANRVHQLEGRCSALEQELASTAAALQAAQQLAGSRALHQQQQPPPPQPQQREGEEYKAQRRQRRAGSFSLSDLCDLEGAVSQIDGCTSPQHSSGTSLPSRQHAMRQRQAAATQRQQRQQRQQEQEDEEAAAGAGAEGVGGQLSLVADLQRQLLEQQHQLAVLQLQQQVGAREGAVLQRSEPPGAACGLEQQVQKLSRRNTQLQSALAEATLQHSRAASTAEKQLQEARQEAAQLRQRLNETSLQLAALQSAALGSGEGSEGSGLAACSHEQLEQLLGEVLEYSERANELVATNAALVQEKRGWLEKLAAAEAEAERFRGEAQQLRLRLLPSRADEQVLQAVAAEAALRSLLLEARQELMGACRALSGELHRVHKLEELRIRDVAELRRLHLCLHEARQDCHKLAKALATAQQQLAAGGKRAERLEGWQPAGLAGSNAGAAGSDWRIAALGGSRAE